MSEEEREFMKNVDNKILNSSPKTLEKLKKLDLQTQLKENSFYEAYSKFRRPASQEKTSSKPSVFRKSKNL